MSKYRQQITKLIAINKSGNAHNNEEEHVKVVFAPV